MVSGPNLRIAADLGCDSARAPGMADSGREAGTLDSGLRDETLGRSDPSPGKDAHQNESSWVRVPSQRR